MIEATETKNVETYWALRTWAGSCNFCALDDYERVMIVRSGNELRRISTRFCPTCARELLETLRNELSR